LSQFQLEIRVKPRPGLLDPQGKAIHNALHSLGWDSIEDVRVGKVIYLELEADSREIAVDRVHAMCRKLLSNPVTEDFEVSVSEEVEAEPL
tara:strand:+ start:2185 stop:2457 length:273 start_codon:yes stop_codon:yes gene_type:complete